MNGYFILIVGIIALFGLLAWVFARYIKQEEKLDNMANEVRRRKRSEKLAVNHDEQDTVDALRAGRF